MALQPQLVDIVLKGLDTGGDNKLKVPGELSELENARLTTRTRITKRFGSGLVTTTSGIERVYGLGPNAFHIRSTPYETFERFDSTLFSNNSYGGMAAPRAFSDYVGGGVKVFNEEASWIVDSVRLNSTTVVVAIKGGTPSGVGTRFVWYDTTTEKVIATRDETTVTFGRLIVAGTTILSGGWVNPTLDIHEITTSGATLRLSIPDPWAGAYSSVLWDWAADSTGAAVYIGYVQSTSTSTLKLYKLTISGWAASATATWAAGGAVTAIGVGAYSTCRVFWSNGVTGLSTRTYSSALANTLATTVVSATLDARYVIGVHVNSSEQAHLAWNVTGAGSGTVLHQRICYALVSTLGVPGTIVTTRGAGLASKPYVFSDNGTDRVFAMGALGIRASSTTSGQDDQRGYVFLEIARSNPIRARMLYGTAGLPPANLTPASLTARYGHLVNLHQWGSSSNTFGCAGVSFDTAARSAANSIENLPNPRLLVCSMDRTRGYVGAEFHGGLLITGGVLHSFDGVAMRENGYLAYPKIVATATGAGVGNTMADGTYSVVAVYERVDARGRVIQSAPSPPVQVTIAGGGGLGYIDVTVTPYHHALNSDYDRIVIYQTRSGSSTYLRAVYGTNDPTTYGDEQTLRCTSADATLAAYEQLYTTGGEGDHAQPSAPLGIAVDKDRAYVFCGDERQASKHSKPLLEGYGLSFYADAYRIVATDDGPITAIGRMDGKLFAFKEKGAYYAPGDGPDGSGNNDTLGEFERLALNIGAANERSVLNTPDGLMVYGTAGLNLLRRDLAVDPAGVPVRGRIYSSSGLLTLRDACFGVDPIEGRKEARFLLSDGTELVYNTEFGLWSYNPTIYAKAIASVAGVRYFATDTAFTGTSAGLYKESSATFLDAHRSSSQFYSLSLVLAWVKLAGLAGFGRAYQLGVLAEGPTWTLGVSFGFDYDTSWSTEQTIDISTIAATGGVAQALAEFPQQQCEAFRARIREAAPAGQTTPGASISGLALEAGIYPRGHRIPSYKRF
jgi:hypothetical protein